MRGEEGEREADAVPSPGPLPVSLRYALGPCGPWLATLASKCSAKREQRRRTHSPLVVADKQLACKPRSEAA